MHARMLGGRVPDAEFATRAWRVKDVASDFDLEDVWELPGEGDAADFPRLVELVCGMDPARGRWTPTRLLWAVRWKLGAVLGWDDEGEGLGGRVGSLRDRLPEDLRASAPPAFAALPFTALYLTDDEFAAEIANKTMHGVMHLGWVRSPTGKYRAQMAVLVKPNG